MQVSKHSESENSGVSDEDDQSGECIVIIRPQDAVWCV